MARPAQPSGSIEGPPASEAMARPVVLWVRGAVVRFGSAPALDALDLDVAEGELVAVLGPSGCGKSTLLRAIAGLQTLDGGEIRWEGRDLANVAVHRRDFGLMFQDHALFSHKDVGANVAFGLRMRKMAPAAVANRVDEVLEMVGLGGYQRREVATLSGGEAQRVALARALAPRPRLLMLDEPLGSLDRGLRDALAEQLRSVLRTAGVTALHVTHDHDEAFAVADRVAVINQGRVERIGTTAQVWRDPRTEFTARFLGHRNIVTITAPSGAATAVDKTRLNMAPWGPIDAPIGRVVVRSDAFTRVELDPAGHGVPPDEAGATASTSSTHEGVSGSRPSAAAGSGDEPEVATTRGATEANRVTGSVTDARFRGDRFELRLRTIPSHQELVVLDTHGAAPGDLRRYEINPAGVVSLTCLPPAEDSPEGSNR